MIPLRRLNRIATLAILPMMALAIVGFSQLAERTAKAIIPNEGTIVVAELRGESVTFLDLANGTSRQLAMPGPAHELATDGKRVYVSLGRGGAIVEVDPAGPLLTRVQRLDGTPHGLALDGDSLLVTLDSARELLTLDRSSLSVTKRDFVGDTPHAVASGPQGLFVTDSRENRLRKLPGGETAPTGDVPESVALVGEFVVTADNVGGTLTVLRADTLAPYRTIAVGLGPVRVVALGAERVAVALGAKAQLAIVNVRTGEVEKRVAVLGRPDGICLNHDATFAAVVSNEANAIQVFRVSDWRLAGTLTVGNGPGSCLWLAKY